MKSLLKNDEGIAFGIVTVIVFILAVGGFYLILSVAFNTIFSTANTMITDNEVPQRSLDALLFDKKVLSAIPLFTIMGALLWAWIRALEMRTTEG